MYYAPVAPNTQAQGSSERPGATQHNAVSVVSAIFRHLPLLLLIFFGTVAITAIVTLLTPKQYGSDMKIIVQNAREVEVLNSSKNDVPPASAAAADTDARVNSEIELLGDKDLLEHLVIFRSKLVSEGDAPQPGSKEMALAIGRMAKRFDIEPVKKSNVITLSYTDISPELAQQVLRELERTYLQTHVALSRPAGAFKFFNDEVESYDKRLNEAEKRLADFRNENQFVDLAHEKTALDDNLHALQVTSLADEAQLRSTTSQIDEIGRRKTAIQNRIPTTETTTPNQQGIQALIATLTELRNNRIQLLNRYKTTDRLAVENEDEIKNTEASLAALRSGSALQSSTDNNPAWLALEQQLENLQVTRAGLVESLRIHKAQEASYHERLDLLQSITPENDDLERQVAEMRGMNQSISDKRDSERVEDLLDAARFGNVAVALQPTYSRLHVKPRLSLNLLLGIVTGIFLCAATLVVLESTRSKILSASDLESFYSAPVLATIPDYPGLANAFGSRA